MNTSPIALSLSFTPMTDKILKLTFQEFFFETGLDIREFIFEASSMGSLAQFGQTSSACRKSVQLYLRTRIRYFLNPFMGPGA